VDYLELAAALDADLLDHGRTEAAQGWIGSVVQRVAGRNAAMALRCLALRKRYDLIFTDGEQVGLPLAVLFSVVPRGRRPRHLMIVHILSVPKKVWLYRALRLGRRIDEMVVYSTAQKDFLAGRLGYPAAQIALIPFMVDTAFFAPRPSLGLPAGPAVEQAVICSAGLEFRDYATMLAAVDGVDARVVLAAASPWSKRASQLDGIVLPPNVEVVRLDLHELRDLYAEAAIVVMPLHEVDFQAGVTTLLEAMAMARPIICTRTTGQTDVIIDGVTGIYVPPADPVAMRSAITSLLADEGRRLQLGSAARRWVAESADIEVYVGLLKALVDEQLAIGASNGSVESCC
jgi:glycosyltransferase involved in cell wall biosynthesis